MRIQVKSQGYHIVIPVPTNLVFGKGTVWFANHVARKYAQEEMKDIPPEALEALFAEFRRIKRKYGHWDLVEVKSSSGDEVLIRL